MLVTIIIFLAFLGLGYTYGWGSLLLLKKMMRIQAEDQLSFPWVVVVGMVVITSIAGVISLLLPLSLPALGLIIAGGLAIVGLQWKKFWAYKKIKFFNISFFVWGLLAILVISILESGTHSPVNYDTGLYHAQTIRWIEEYPVIPGLGNLNGRFAFNSNWLLINALFSFAFLGIQSFHALPTAFFFICMLISLEGANAWLKGKSTPANIFKTLLIPCALSSIR